MVDLVLPRRGTILVKSNGEAVHAFKQWRERVADLRGAGGLPVERPAVHLHEERIRARAFEVRVHNHGDELFLEVHPCGAEPRLAGRVDKLQQATKVERELVEEFNAERREERRVEPRQDALQIGAATPQDK